LVGDVRCDDAVNALVSQELIVVRTAPGAPGDPLFAVWACRA
jgi:hypothetical protein